MKYSHSATASDTLRRTSSFVLTRLRAAIPVIEVGAVVTLLGHAARLWHREGGRFTRRTRRGGENQLSNLRLSATSA